MTVGTSELRLSLPKKGQILPDQEGGGKQEIISMILQDCKESTDPDEKEVLTAESGTIVWGGNLRWQNTP